MHFNDRNIKKAISDNVDLKKKNSVILNPK